ncbi:metallophosphoesterase family protein (plasmid) [Cupriavidus basilensis]
MKIAHMSDLHYSASHLAESNRCFGAAVSHAIAAGVDVAVITGDATDHALDAHEPAFRELAKQIQRLANHCPVLLLQGTFSHEPPGLLRVLELVGARHPIAVADRIGQLALVQGQWHSKGLTWDGPADLVVTCLPTVNKADLIASVGPLQAGAEVGVVLHGLLERFGTVNATLFAQGVPTLLIGHGTVDGCLTEHGVPMAGQDHEFNLGSLFQANTDAVALGHIHKQQEWRRDFGGRHQIVAYAGSIGRFHYGEDGDKAALIWNLQPGAPAYEVFVTPARVTIEVQFDGPPDMATIRELGERCAGAFVRVRYLVDEEHLQSVDRAAIKAALHGAADVKLEGKTLVVERQRAAGISTAATLNEKVQMWCAQTQTAFEPLRDRLDALQCDTPDAIANAILQRLSATTTAATTATPAGGVTALAEPTTMVEAEPVPNASQEASYGLTEDLFA